MKKKVLAILATLILCVSFTACGKTGTENSKESSDLKSAVASSESGQTSKVSEKSSSAKEYKTKATLIIKDDSNNRLSDLTLEYSFDGKNEIKHNGDYAEKTTLVTDSNGLGLVDVKEGNFAYRLTKEGYEPSDDLIMNISRDEYIHEATIVMKKIRGQTGVFETSLSIVTEFEAPDENGDFYIAWEATKWTPAGEIRAKVDSNTAFYFSYVKGSDGNYMEPKATDENAFFETITNSLEEIRQYHRYELGLDIYVENGVATSMYLVSP